MDDAVQADSIPAHPEQADTTELDAAHSVLSRLLQRSEASPPAPLAPDVEPIRAVVGDRWGGRAVVLTDVELPRCRSTVDVVVVSPAGVWVLDVLAASVPPELREVGGFFHAERRLFVDGQDRSADLDELVWQQVACLAAIARVDRQDPRHEVVSTALVLCGTDGGVAAPDDPIRFEDQWICTPAGLDELLSAAEVLDDEAVAAVAAALDVHTVGSDGTSLTGTGPIDGPTIDLTDPPAEPMTTRSHTSVGR